MEEEQLAGNPTTQYLIHLCNKYGDFKVAIGDQRDKDKPKWTKHQKVLLLWESDKGMEFLGRVNCRQILPCEIVLDMDNDVSEKKLNEICDILDKYGFPFKAYFTGSKGFHIHIFDDDLAKYSEQSRYKIRHFLISKFGCDTMKASEKTMIALENVPHFKTGNPKKIVRESK